MAEQMRKEIIEMLLAEPPEWHLEFLKSREKALADEADSFISLDELEEVLLCELK